MPALILALNLSPVPQTWGKAESETADLWQPKSKENQIALATVIHTSDRDEGLLEGTVAGSWSLGIVEQSQGEGCC